MGSLNKINLSLISLISANLHLDWPVASFRGETFRHPIIRTSHVTLLASNGLDVSNSKAVRCRIGLPRNRPIFL